jgi:predicted nucleic-acid-binding Zn-ribbon protein
MGSEGIQIRHDYRCPRCGSRDVLSDAAAQWNVEQQCWEIRDTYDCTTCQDCGYDANCGFETVVS